MTDSKDIVVLSRTEALVAKQALRRYAETTAARIETLEDIQSKLDHKDTESTEAALNRVRLNGAWADAGYIEDAMQAIERQLS